MNGFFKATPIRGLIVPTEILEDNRLSLSAKGLYIQLLAKNEEIKSLNDISKYINGTEEDIELSYNELADNGYISVNKQGIGELLKKPKGERAVQNNRDKVDDLKEYVKEPTKKLSAYEKMVNIINGYDLSENVKQLLVTYFEKWLNKRGRFSEADQLHGYIVRQKIGDLVSFHLSEDDQVACIQQSIDKEWYVFVPIKQTAFDKSKLSSGTYTQKDIENIKSRAKELELNGERGTF